MDQDWTQMLLRSLLQVSQVEKDSNHHGGGKWNRSRDEKEGIGHWEEHQLGDGDELRMFTWFCLQGICGDQEVQTGEEHGCDFWETARKWRILITQTTLNNNHTSNNYNNA